MMPEKTHPSIISLEESYPDLIAHTNDLWSCPLCPYAAVSGPHDFIENHILSAHDSKSIKSNGLRYLKCSLDCNVLRNRMHYHCSYCSKAVISRGDFILHLKSHSKNKPNRKRGLTTLKNRTLNTQLFTHCCVIVSPHILPLIENSSEFWDRFTRNNKIKYITDENHSLVVLHGSYPAVSKCKTELDKFLHDIIQTSTENPNQPTINNQNIISEQERSTLTTHNDLDPQMDDSLPSASVDSTAENRRSVRKRKVNSLLSDYIVSHRINDNPIKPGETTTNLGQTAGLANADNESSDDTLKLLQKDVKQDVSLSLNLNTQSESDHYQINVNVSKAEISEREITPNTDEKETVTFDTDQSILVEIDEDDEDSDYSPTQSDDEAQARVKHIKPVQEKEAELSGITLHVPADNRTVDREEVYAMIPDSDGIVRNDTGNEVLDREAVETEEQYVLLVKENAVSPQPQVSFTSNNPSPAKQISFRCNTCHRSYVSIASLMKHKPTCLPPQEKTTPNASKIIVLSNKKTSTVPKHACQQCCYVAKAAYELKLHNAREHQEKRFECEDCGEMFGPLVDLKEHIKSTGHADGKHANLAQKMVNCKFCGRSLQLKNLQPHIASVHEKKRDFGCETCGKMFGTKFGLREHIDIHKSEDQRHRRYKCHICGQGFFKKLPRDEHVSKHQGTPGYSCALCNKKFYHQSGFKRHLQHHANIRKYVCQICKKAFKTSTNLSAHKTVHKPNTYICMCGKCYHQKHTLKSHQEKCIIHQDLLATQITEEQYPTTSEQISEFDRTTLLQISQPLNTINRYMCGFCRESFDNFNEVQEHVRNHALDSNDTLVDLGGEELDTVVIEQTNQSTEISAVNSATSNNTQMATQTLLVTDEQLTQLVDFTTSQQVQ